MPRKHGYERLFLKILLIMNTNDLSLFMHIADSGSITSAAEQLDMTLATASSTLKRLEKQLEVQLFIRTTRQIRITAEGERFLVYCRKALNQLDEGMLKLNLKRSLKIQKVKDYKKTHLK